MPLPWSTELAGRIDEHVISSDLLRGNPLGDPYERPLLVYTPPGYDDAPGRRYPAVYVVQGYTGHVVMWRGRSPFRQPFPGTADAMFARAEAPPAIVVYVDAWTAYGGSQFVDSPGTGQYHSYLCDEVVPWVDARYRTIPDAAHRAITGKSSGGFGAMITPMLRPDLFGALATHAGDAYYEYCYLPEFPQVVRDLRNYGGDIFRWWDDFRSRVAYTKPEDSNLVAALGVAAAFSARPDGTPELPMDPETACCGRMCGNGGSTGTRCAWFPGTRTPCGPCGPSGSTPGTGTTSTWISARRRSARRWRRPGSPTRRSTTSSSTPRTRASTTGIRCRWPGSASG